MNHVRKHYGTLLILLGIAHIIVAIIQFWDGWVELVGDGFVNQIDERGDSWQALGYWFFILGPMLIATGVLARSHLNATGALPPAFGWIVALTSFGAALAMPANGMWAVGIVGLLGIRLSEPAAPGSGQRAAPSGDPHPAPRS